MHITHLTLKHFRCFEHLELDFEHPTVVLEGLNGAGKTSLLESLHYLCYLRSFRTYSPSELIKQGAESFFIKASFTTDEQSHEVQVGFTDKKRVVKIDGTPITSYKQLVDHYRVVTITEDDLELIKGSPQERRQFIDQLLMLLDPAYALLLKKAKQVLEQRNALLRHIRVADDQYQLWTDQLFTISAHLAQAREQAIAQLVAHVAQLVSDYADNAYRIELSYQPKFSYEQPERCHQLFNQERRFGRSLFGFHLDDVTIDFQDRKSKLFASRGQQKLIILLLKMAQLQLVAQAKGPSALLLDDFMTDFDAPRAALIMQALGQVADQLILTSPVKSSALSQALVGRQVHTLSLTY